MSEDLVEAISVDDAVSQMVEEPKKVSQDADDVTESAEAEEVETEETEDEELEADDNGGADDPDDEESGGDEEEGDEVETHDDPTFEVETVDGKEEVKLSELIEGRMLKSDYTKKTMALADERKTIERELADTSQMKQQLTEALSYWAVPTSQEPDWAEMAQSKTAQEVFAAQQDWREQTERQEQAAQYHQALQQQETENYLKAEQEKLLTAFPEWRDPGVFKTEFAKLAETGGDYGISQEEIGQITDHRMFKVLVDAAKYRALQRAKPKVTKKVSKAPSKLKSGARSEKGTNKKAARQKQQERLRKSGSVDDAIALLMME